MSVVREILEAGKSAYLNRPAIEAAEVATCYGCERVVLPSSVKNWTDGGQTAICPHCGVDSVLPFNKPQSWLHLAHEYWFEKGSPLNTGNPDDELVCRCKRDDGSIQFNINCTIHGSL